MMQNQNKLLVNTFYFKTFMSSMGGGGGGVFSQCTHEKTSVASEGNVANIN